MVYLHSINKDIVRQSIPIYKELKFQLPFFSCPFLSNLLPYVVSVLACPTLLSRPPPGFLVRASSLARSARPAPPWPPSMPRSRWASLPSASATPSLHSRCFTPVRFPASPSAPPPQPDPRGRHRHGHRPCRGRGWRAAARRHDVVPADGEVRERVWIVVEVAELVPLRRGRGRPAEERGASGL